jgi:hypothetical protein
VASKGNKQNPTEDSASDSQLKTTHQGIVLQAKIMMLDMNPTILMSQLQIYVKT